MFCLNLKQKHRTTYALNDEVPQGSVLGPILIIFIPKAVLLRFFIYFNLTIYGAVRIPSNGHKSTLPAISRFPKTLATFQHGVQSVLKKISKLKKWMTKEVPRLKNEGQLQEINGI